MRHASTHATALTAFNAVTAFNPFIVVALLFLTGCPQDAEESGAFGSGTDAAGVVDSAGTDAPSGHKDAENTGTIADTGSKTAGDSGAGAVDAAKSPVDSSSATADSAGDQDAGTAVDAGPKHVVGSMFAAAIEAGDYHTCALHGTGFVSCWGDNSNGETGAKPGPTSVSTKPNPVQTVAGVTALSSKTKHTCALLGGGKVACWGHNFWGDLGIGVKGSQDVYIPQVIKGFKGVVKVSAGGDYTFTRKTDGSVWGWGKNVTGHLLDGTAGAALIPIKVGSATALPAVSDICSAANHVCAIRASDQTALCWGRGTDGQVGNGKTGSGNLVKVPTVVVKAPKASRIFCGYDHTCALTKAGQMWCWGRNSSSQLGNKSTNTAAEAVWSEQVGGVKQAALGTSHTCVVDNYGKVKCWGRNEYGQIGVGPGKGKTIKIVAIVPLPKKAVAVTAGRAHTCAALVDGSAWCWGRNHKSQLGDGTKTDSPSPVKVVVK